jgi:hypothetical protein
MPRKQLGKAATSGADLITRADALALLAGLSPPPQGRLTLTSGTPVLTSNVLAAPTIFYTPSIGNLCPVWNGSTFAPVAFTEVSQTLSDATKSPAAAVVGQVYDLFAWLDGATFRVTRGPAWAAGATAGNNTTRGAGAGSTALSRVAGIFVNQFAITNGPAAGYGTYLGTIATDNGGATITFDAVSSAAGGGLCSVNLWNAYNPAAVAVFLQDTTATHTYSSSSIRPFNASTQNAIYFVRGLNTDGVDARLKTRLTLTTASNGGAAVGIGLNSSTAFASQCNPAALATAPGASASVTGSYSGLPGLGVGYFMALEQSDGSNAHTFYGSAWMALTASMRF